MTQKKPRPKRNRNGVGNVRQLREHLFQGSIQLAPGDRRYVSGHTRQEAEQKLAELRVLYQQGRLPPRSAQTVGDYLRGWLRDDVRPSKAPRTVDNYELNVRRIEPFIGSLRLDALKPDHIKTAYRGLMETGLSARSVQQVHRVLRAALRQAVRSEYLYRDPTTGVSPPRAEERPEAVLTPAQIRTLFRTTCDTVWYPLWVLLATTGVRIGEALGLQWRDLDLEAGLLIVRRQTQRQKDRGLVLTDVKTPASRRVVPLVPGTVAVLRKQRREAMERGFAIGKPWSEDEQVFATIDGTLIDPGTVDKAFRRSLEAAGLPRIRVHDLRHTFSSYIQSQGRTDREAQEVLGHASAVTTRRIYTHVMPDRRRDIVSPVEEFFQVDGSA